MGINMSRILLFACIGITSLSAMDKEPQRDPVMDDLEIGVYTNIEEVTKEYAQLYVNKLSKHLGNKLNKTDKKRMISDVQKQLLSMKKSKTRAISKGFEQFENFVASVKSRKRSVDNEKLSNDALPDEAKQLMGLAQLLQQQLLDKQTKLIDKKDQLKQQATELQEDINQKVQTIGEKAKTIKKRTIAGIGGTIVAFLSGGGLGAISDLISKFTSNNCQLKTNCQTLMNQNGSLTELESFCAGVISNCK